MGGGINQGDNSARGTLTVTARVSNGASRYAMPMIPELVYAALLYKNGNSPENPPSKDFVEGTKAADSEKLLFSFQRPDDTSGTFTLEVCAFVKADVEAEDGTANFSRNSVFLSGMKHGLTIDDDSDEIEVDGPIALSFREPETVNLKIKVPDGCMLTIDDTTHFAVTGTSPNFIVKQTGTKIPAGSYPVTFTVKKGDEIVHVFPENINVINGLCTDTWWNGDVSYEVKDVAQSISKTVYVRGACGYYDNTSPYNEGETAKADDSNLGSLSSPFATIQKAVDAIIARNDGESEYTINIDGTLKYDENTYIGERGMAYFSTLDKRLNLTIKSLSDTATLNGGAEFDADGNIIDGKEGIGKSIIYALSGTNGALNLTIKNLVITSNSSRGVFVGSRSSVFMEECEISRCKVISSSTGGAVYVDTNGMFTMESGTISDCKAGSGGGVYVTNGGTFTMKNDSTITANTASNVGGGVSVCNIGGTFTMEGGTISGNTAISCGGGVYVKSGKFTMNGGTISGNKSSNGQSHGVCLSYVGTFNMSGSAKFIGDNDVYLSSKDLDIPTITVTGALSASSPVATITPSDYTENRPLLIAGEGVTLSGSICSKFAVTPKNGTEWRCALDGADGVLIRKYEIGDTGPGGGAVYDYKGDGFAVNGKTCHYLEASKDSLGNFPWCPCTDDSGYCEVTLFNGYGKGYDNTQAIINHSNHASATATDYAAKACAEYSTETTTAGEWFLPNYSESALIYRGMGITGEENLWSSSKGSATINDNSMAVFFIFTPGSSRYRDAPKKDFLPVRAVHAF